LKPYWPLTRPFSAERRREGEGFEGNDQKKKDKKISGTDHWRPSGLTLPSVAIIEKAHRYFR
jgi:hypothetical protein